MAIQPKLEIDQLFAELAALARISAAAPPVVTRVVFSEADLRARGYVKGLCADAGLRIREDAIGNTFARWVGAEPALAAVGSQRAARSTQDEVATITVTANSAGPATLNTLQLTLTGSLVSSTVSSTFFNNVSLWLNGTQLTSAQATDTYNTASGTIIWSFKTGTTLGTQISAGASDVFQLVINDNQGTSLGSNGTSLGLNIAIQNTGDVNYTDSSLGAGGTTVSLPANIVPMSTQVSFGQGV